MTPGQNSYGSDDPHDGDKPWDFEKSKTAPRALRPDDPANPAERARRSRREREALERAKRYAAVDPFYSGRPITVREFALMRMALRCYTEPTLADIMTVKLELQADRG